MSEDDPYTRPENMFCTDGRDVCHWCYLRPQAWVWEPYGTRVCDMCQNTIDAGRSQDIVEEHAARLTVRDGWHTLDAERWRKHEHLRMELWIELRTQCRPVEPD